MDVVLLAKFLNEISQSEFHYDELSPKIQKVYQDRAQWIIDFFEKNHWEDTSKEK